MSPDITRCPMGGGVKSPTGENHWSRDLTINQTTANFGSRSGSVAGCSTTDSSQRALREEELLVYKRPSVPNAFLPFLHPSNSYSLLSAQPTRSPPLPHSEKSPHVPPKPLCSNDVSPDSLAHLLLRVGILRKQKVFLTFRTPVPSKTG